MSKAWAPVNCAQHGERRSTLVCRHLTRGEKLGFFTAAEDDPENPWPGAWCGACEKLLEEDKGWSERAREFARVTLVCDKCYEVFRERNRA